jgi:hypothetical protein
VAFQVADRHPAPAVGSADHGGEHQFHGGLLIRQPAGDLGAAAFLDLTLISAAGFGLP